MISALSPQGLHDTRTADIRYVIPLIVVGAVIASGAPRNPIGWLLLSVGFTFQVLASAEVSEDEASAVSCQETGRKALGERVSR